jgi:TolA-binding protein
MICRDEYLTKPLLQLMTLELCNSRGLFRAFHQKDFTSSYFECLSAWIKSTMQNPPQKTLRLIQSHSRAAFSSTIYRGFSRLGALSLAILVTSVSAEVQIESRPLSQPAPPPVAIVTPEKSEVSQLWLITQKIQKLEEEVRTLSGKIENHDNDIDQLQKDAKNRFVDFDQRLGQVQEDVKKLQSVPATTPVTNTSVAPQPADTTTGNTIAPSIAGNTTVDLANSAADESDKVAYIAAYEAYKAGGAAQAIAPMKKFIANYPQSPFVPNGYYWLGEFNLAITPPNFAAASANFKIVTTKYPKTAKAAAATYRLATLADVDQRQADAIVLMQRLQKDYPGTKEAEYATEYLKSNGSKTTHKKPEKAEDKKSDISKDKKVKKDR